MISLLQGFIVGIVNVAVIYAITSLEIETENCQLTEPIYNYTFDLTQLHSDIAHALRSSKNDHFEFNFCGNLTKSCNNQINVAACLTRNNKQYILGNQHTLNYRNGKMYFNFIGGDLCKHGEQYRLQVILACDYTLDDKQLELTAYDDEQCTFYMKYETPFACLPENNNNSNSLNTCRVTNNDGFTFDLMPLSDENRWTSAKNGSFFVINVCKPVLYGLNAMCPPGSSICFIDNSETDITKRYKNFGTVTNKIEIVENGLMMRHSSDKNCNANRNFTSTIFLTCSDYNDNNYGKPVFINRIDCNYNFVWETSLACEKLKFCAGHNYDLSSLSNKKYTVSSKDGKKYIFSICSGLEGQKSGARLYGEELSFGDYKEHLSFSNIGLPYLLYESDQQCSDKGKWSTKIEFICNSNEEEIEKYGPAKIVENSNCLLQIHFQTKLVCKNHILCKGQLFSDEKNEKSDRTYDLTSLMSSTENYIALVNKDKQENNSNLRYSLNVCRPLVSESNLGCAGGSAACMSVMDSGIPENEMSLGYPENSLIITGENEAEIRYSNGDICAADKSQRYSSTIRFICNTNEKKGSPILESLDDNCHYKFVWPTNVICPEHHCRFNSQNCEIINEDLKERYSFLNSTYAKNGIIIVDQMKNFAIEICGEQRTIVTDYSQSIVDVIFNTNKTCKESVSTGYYVQLRLICSDIQHRTVSIMDDECIIVITQQTTDICSFLGIEKVAEKTTLLPQTKIEMTTTKNLVETTTATSNVPSATSATGWHLAIIVILMVLVVILFVTNFIIIMMRRPSLRERLRNLFRRDSFNSVHYSRVNTSEEASLLLAADDMFDDSDDDLIA